MKNYHHLALCEREMIFLYQGQGKSTREIGRLLGRNHRTIAREIKRNSHSQYLPSLAQKLACDRRKESKTGKLSDPTLKHYIIGKLGKHWSPEQIAGRLRLKVPSLSISFESIYQFVYAKENRSLKLWDFLRRRHPKRQLFQQRKVKVRSIPNRVFIENRPLKATLRKEAGHWETDNMEGLKKIPGAVSVNVERKSHLTRLFKLTNKQAEEKSNSLITQFDSWPRNLVKTLTMDNGTENYEHEKVTQALGCKTYFCHPYHAWEKGTVENTIGLVRQYFPKRTDLSGITQADLNWVAWELNNRPRKILGFYTPSEILYKDTGWVT